jgi:hypothetical protein
LPAVAYLSISFQPQFSILNSVAFPLHAGRRAHNGPRGLDGVGTLLSWLPVSFNLLPAFIRLVIVSSIVSSLSTYQQPISAPGSGAKR